MRRALPVDPTSCMAALRYSTDGLIGFATCCDLHAENVAAGYPPTLAVTNAQATTAAVAALHADICATSIVLSGRIRSTSDAVQTTAHHFAKAEQQAAEAGRVPSGSSCVV
jgi:hypothetical protein